MKRVLILSVIATLVFVQIVRATAVEKITWCHTEPNGNQQTLELPQAALENAGHMDANGNPLHVGDHLGTCIESTTTPAIGPTITQEPSLIPTSIPTASTSATLIDSFSLGGGNDGRSDVLSSCPDCNKAPVVPEGTPNTGRGK